MRSNQSILKEISPGCSLEGMMLKLKLWPPHAKSWLIGKDSDVGRDWWQEEKGMTEDEMAGWHHGLDGHEFEWTLGVSDRQGGLACCDSWGRKEPNTTEWLNWTELRYHIKNQRHYFANKRPSSQGYGFPSGHVWMWVWVNSGSWWWTGRPGVLRLMGSQRVGHNWGAQLSDWTEQNWCEELPHWKRLWCWERLREGGEGGDRRWDGWMHYWLKLNEHVFEQTPGDSEGQGGVACCSPWGHKELSMT